MQKNMMARCNDSWCLSLIQLFTKRFNLTEAKYKGTACNTDGRCQKIFK